MSNTYDELPDDIKKIIEWNVNKGLDQVRARTIGLNTGDLNKEFMDQIERSLRKRYSVVERDKITITQLVHAYEGALDDMKKYYEDIIQRKSSLNG